MTAKDIHFIDISGNTQQGGHSLGKGEVESSIPSGSTIKCPYRIDCFCSYGAGLPPSRERLLASKRLKNDMRLYGDGMGTVDTPTQDARQ